MPTHTGINGIEEATQGLASMPEMPCAGEGHRHAPLVGGLDDFLVAHGAAGLNRRCRPRFRRRNQSVRKRKERIAANGLEQFVRKIDYLPHSEVIKEQQKTKVLLLLVNQTKNAKGILTGKIFEYLAAQVPILAIGPPDGDLAEVLNKTKAGLISDFNDENQLRENILALYNKKVINFDVSEIARYSRRELTKELSGVLNKLIIE